MAMRVATFFPFQPTYYLNGHSFIEQELNRAQVGFRKDDNAFLAVDDVAALQAAADKLSPDIIRERLDYWTLILGPKFSVKERKRVKLSRFYAISQTEYCRNFIFKRNFPIHKLFERGCELGLWRLTAHKIAEIFGARLHRRLPGKLATVIDQIEHGHHVFRAYFKHAFLKQYEKFATFLRNELCSNNLNDFGLSKVTDCLSATDPATLTASPQRVFKSRCYFYSSTNGYADPLPTAASTTAQTLNIAQTADSKPPITAPTRPSRISSICSPQLDAATS